MRMLSLTIALALAAGVASGQTIEVEGDDQKTVPGKPLNAVFPERRQWLMDISAVVRVRISVDKAGTVTKAEALSGPVMFRPASEKAAMDTKFSPGTRKGKPVRFDAVMNFTFGKLAPRCTDTRLIIHGRPKPRYTTEAREDNIKGQVVLMVTFPASGEPVEVQVVRGLKGGLTDEAVRAAKAFSFEPACKDGIRVPVTRSFTYSFKIY